jgi:hypothetical protein
MEYSRKYSEKNWCVGGQCGVCCGVWKYHMEYGSITWSTGVLHGVREFHMEYGSIIWSTGV